MDVVREDADLFVVTDGGYAKRTSVDEYPVKGRGGLGREGSQPGGSSR